LLAYLFFMQSGNQTGQIITKPLLMPVLLGYFLSSQKGKIRTGGKWLTGGLLFSMAGDTFLLFQDKNSIFFLLGLSAFLLAHICYIGLFWGIKKENGIEVRWLLPVIVIIYYSVLMTVLFPYLSAMRVPVIVYGAVISIMLLLALHAVFIRGGKGGWGMAAGAVFFVMSDSLLAFNKFYQPFGGAGIYIIVTYAIAQSWITEGAVAYMQGITGAKK
jgi:uncharacterized membrane protein YhhN